MEEEKEDSDKKVLEASKLRMEVEELREGIASNNALRNPSLRDFPIVLISAWQPNAIASPQTVTFDSFLTNYNAGGGDGVLDLDSGVFTCLTSMDTIPSPSLPEVLWVFTILTRFYTCSRTERSFLKVDGNFGTMEASLKWTLK